MDDVRNTSVLSQICRLGITSTSIMACVCLYIQNKYKNEWKKRFMTGDIIDPKDIHFMYDEIINEQSDCFDQSERVLTRYLMLQIIMLMIGPIPGFDLYIPMTCIIDSKPEQI